MSLKTAWVGVGSEEVFLGLLAMFVLVSACFIARKLRDIYKAKISNSRPTQGW